MSARTDAARARVPDAELRRALERVIGRTTRGKRRIAALTRRPSDYHSSFAIEELTVRFADGTDLAIIFKDLSPRAMLDGARAAKPDFVCHPLREIEVYRTVLEPAGLGTAELYGHVVDPPRGRYWLFLEDVPGIELYQVGERVVWERVARWLGRMHRSLSRLVREASANVPLLRHDEGFHRRWLERARAFHGDDSRMRRRLQALATRYDRILDRVTALPTTIIHGEFYASNVLVDPSPSGQRVCPVDWEMAALGAGLMDLAALTAGNWSEREAGGLMRAYRDAWGDGDGAQMTEREFRDAVAACRVLMAVQWLGWAKAWSPPVEHRRDWLREAVVQAEGL